MNRDEVYALAVGMALDRAVSRVVFGHELEQPPAYSTDIAAAWLVVEHLREAGWLVVTKSMPDGFPFLLGDDWVTDPKMFTRATCNLSWMRKDSPTDARKSIFLRPWTRGDSVPEAVCRAALLAADAEAAREEAGVEGAS